MACVRAFSMAVTAKYLPRPIEKPPKTGVHATRMQHECNTKKEGAAAPSVLLPFLIRYEFSHKPLDSLSLAYPGAVTRLLKLFRKRTVHLKTLRDVAILRVPTILRPFFTHRLSLHARNAARPSSPATMAITIITSMFICFLE